MRDHSFYRTNRFKRSRASVSWLKRFSFGNIRKKQAIVGKMRHEEQAFFSSYRYNPYRRQTVERRINFKSPYFKAILAVIGFLAWGALLLFLPYFEINVIRLSGLQVVRPIEVEQYLHGELSGGLIFSRRNYFVAPLSRLEEKLRQNFPFSSVTIQKKFPDELVLTVQEKISSVIYDDGKDYYLLDSEGVVIKHLAAVGDDEFVTRAVTRTVPSLPEATTSTTTVIKKAVSANATSTLLLTTTTVQTTQRIHKPAYQKIKQRYGDYPLIYDKSALVVSSTPTARLLSSAAIQGILSWQETSKLVGAGEQGGGVPHYFLVDQPGAGVKVFTVMPWYIYIQPTADIKAQFSALSSLLKGAKPTEYVDVRYEGRVYWK